MSEREARRELAATATRRLVSSIDETLGDQLVVEQGTKPDYFDDGVSLDVFSLLERCPRRAAHPADDFENSVATARRRIGLLVMRHLSRAPDDGRLGGTRPRPGVAAAVREVMADPEEWPLRLRDWVESLDRAGVAAVSAAVGTWCHGALRLVGRHDGVVWADPSRPAKWNVPGRVVQLRGGVDAVLGSVVRGEKLLLLGDGVPGPADRLRAGYVALVRSVGTTHAPVRVTLGSPATGVMTPFPVTAELLELATDRVVEMVRHRAEPAIAPPRPGRWCSHCHLLDLCDEGSEHLGRVTPGPTPVALAGPPVPVTASKDSA
jgi:hypothetical protein